MTTKRKRIQNAAALGLQRRKGKAPKDDARTAQDICTKGSKGSVGESKKAKRQANYSHLISDILLAETGPMTLLFVALIVRVVQYSFFWRSS